MVDPGGHAAQWRSSDYSRARVLPRRDRNGLRERTRGTRGTKTQCRQHNRRVSAKICPVQISTPTRPDKSGPFVALGLPGSRDGTISSRARGVSNVGTSRARVSLSFFFLSSITWETDATNRLALPTGRSKIKFNNFSMIEVLANFPFLVDLVTCDRKDSSLTPFRRENLDPATIPCG